ncbi:terpene synthase 10-like isoform X1 [Iris pallida]|uniref:Terpene synthase 10-like isoform X1 n=1 Tax=Iris pallida TaxID=29817 RepID=A0AAX6GYM0_IRIPA|nr:terpene synthase 10-like isoform X1 [Iris pallida]
MATSSFLLSLIPCMPTTTTTALPMWRIPSSQNRLVATANAQISDAIPFRRSANFQPSLWDNSYIQSLKIDPTEKEVTRINMLKEYVKRTLDEEKQAFRRLEIIDTLCQLGVAYHFEQEIENVLGTIYKSVESMTNVEMKEDLHYTALLFRLLREHGYNVSQDVLNIFKDIQNGTFIDTKTLLSLYEASYLAKEGEDMLDEMRHFASKHLQELAASLEPSQREHVVRSLELPLTLRMPRWHSWYFIHAYQKMENMDPNLLELAKLDYNKVQSNYKKELKTLSRWWSNVGFSEKLSFSRDRLVENYLFSIGWAFKPKFERCRENITKVNCFVTTIDDIYDVHGLLDELELFTSAVERWDASTLEELPDYMKICLLGLFDTINETAKDILERKGIQAIPYLRKYWIDLCRAYLVEAKWYHNRYMPTLKEYLDNAWISISAPVIPHLYFFTSQEITKEALEYLESNPEIIRLPLMISRLWNDMASFTDEMKRGDVPKSIQCYMHEESGVEEDVARKFIMGLIDDLWKKLNKERSSCAYFEEPFIVALMDVTRMSQSIYQHGDGYGRQDGKTKDQIMSLLIEPIQL